MKQWSARIGSVGVATIVALTGCGGDDDEAGVGLQSRVDELENQVTDLEAENEELRTALSAAPTLRTVEATDAPSQTTPAPATTVRTTTTTLPATTTAAPTTTQGRRTDPFTVEELDATVAGLANAWLAEPSGPTYDDALAAAVQSLLDQAPPFGGIGRSFPSPTMASAMSRLAAYPGSDNAVVGSLADLGLPSIQTPPIVREGSYLVGSEVQPGTYRAQNVDGCYWATLDQAGEINDNNFVNAAPQVLATVLASDYAFNNDCGLMIKVG
jgi:hypothetical protein